MRKVIIMSGVSGSGKSTYIQDVILGRKMNGNITSFPPGATLAVVSADNYFIGGGGEYNFDSSKLSLAHGECFRNFLSYMESECELVIVDNTNTTAVEIAPYILGAQAYGYEAEIRTIFPTNPYNLETYAKRCAARNTHGVSEGGVLAQANRIFNRELMPWWECKWIEPLV